MNLEQFLNKLINWVTTEGVKLVVWLFLLWIGWKLAKKIVNIMNRTLEKRNVDATIRSFLDTFVEGTGLYLQRLIGSSFELGGFGESSWYSGWTIFYWAWWISWAPFVGIFIARISKGRTIKEFIGGVLLVPAILSFIWFAIFGGIGLSTEISIIKEAAKDTTTAFFIVMNELPLGYLLSIVTILLLFTFFITSANSATFTSQSK